MMAQVMSTMQNSQQSPRSSEPGLLRLGVLVCLLSLGGVSGWAGAAEAQDDKSQTLPAPVLLTYRLHGQEKGFHYQATGELRWQHNASAYAMDLSLKVFLLGSRQWRSQGQITSAGLAPTQFSDSWRKERSAYFDRQAQRIVFSSKAPAVPLQSDAQDQVSLYAQMAVAMAKSAEQFKPGSRLQIQTATVRDALPWRLTLEQVETLQLDGQSLQATKWVAKRLHRDDAQVAFWVAAEHDWLPVRIRISQSSGSVIDLQLTAREPLPDLPQIPLPSAN